MNFTFIQWIGHFCEAAKADQEGLSPSGRFYQGMAAIWCHLPSQGATIPSGTAGILDHHQIKLIKMIKMIKCHSAALKQSLPEAPSGPAQVAGMSGAAAGSHSRLAPASPAGSSSRLLSIIPVAARNKHGKITKQEGRELSGAQP